MATTTYAENLAGKRFALVVVLALGAVLGPAVRRSLSEANAGHIPKDGRSGTDRREEGAQESEGWRSTEGADVQGGRGGRRARGCSDLEAKLGDED